ncbi:MAG: hypothetical protein RIS32_874, partial [Actinomycetota bacterium]
AIAKFEDSASASTMPTTARIDFLFMRLLTSV